MHSRSPHSQLPASACRLTFAVRFAAVGGAPRFDVTANEKRSSRITTSHRMGCDNPQLLHRRCPLAGGRPRRDSFVFVRITISSDRLRCARSTRPVDVALLVYSRETLRISIADASSTALFIGPQCGDEIQYVRNIDVQPVHCFISPMMIHRLVHATPAVLRERNRPYCTRIGDVETMNGNQGVESNYIPCS
ncbi:hypothetical protein EVAR_10874_1 [Eumeta japonica]|uniref:Uncharacterized protein n=1 Tax=Eumeta variegata TaxID=151549 RepID=A0A4C1URI0_EUMVA|nr:hypothetical protein EVAR_10874_1 [Eumeta japonica]